MLTKNLCQCNLCHYPCTTLAIGALGSYIEVHGDWLPRHIFGKCTAYCAIVRMLYLSLVLVSRHLMRRIKLHVSRFLGHTVSLDVDEIVLMDGVSASLPLFFFAGIPSIFYCHFPDKVSYKTLIVDAGLQLQKSLIFPPRTTAHKLKLNHDCISYYVQSVVDS